MRTYALVALGLFVFGIPSENGVTIAGVGSLARVLGALAFAAGLVSLYDRGWIRVRPPSLFVATAAVFALWSLASYFWSSVPGTTIGLSSTYLQLVVFVWLVHQLVRTQRDLDGLLQAFVLGCYVIIAIGITTYFGQGAGFREIGSFNANGFAITSALAVPMAWGLVLRRPFAAPLHVVNVAYPLFATLAVILAASRGGFLTLLVALLVLPLTLTRLGWVWRVALAAFMVALPIVSVVVLPSVAPGLDRNLARLAETGDELRGGTFTGRTTIWSAGVDVFLDSPIIGSGAGSFDRAVEPALGRPRAAHNAFLGVAVGTGLVGLMMLVALVVFALIGAVVRTPGRVERVILWAAIVVGMMPTNSDNDKFAWFVLAALASSGPVIVDARPRDRRMQSQLSDLPTVGESSEFA